MRHRPTDRNYAIRYSEVLKRNVPVYPDEPPPISAKITIQGRVKSIAADTPDELIHKLSRVVAREGIDVWAILTKKKAKP